MTVARIGRAAGTVALGKVVMVAGAAVSYRALDRRWADRWGATAREADAPMPGDDLVSDAVSQSTRAVTIHAPVSDVWPWLVQLGAGRGGLYSYDRVERLMGMDIRNADHIVPAFQHLDVGDAVWVTPEGYPANLVFAVAEIVPERSLVLAFTEDPHSRAVPTSPGWTWSFVLRPTDDGTTRLILRDRQASLGNPVIDAIQGGLVAPVGFVMSRKTLLGIAERAERLAGTRSTRSPDEARFFWLLALGAVAAVAIASTSHRPWWWRLGAGTLAGAGLSRALFRGFPMTGRPTINRPPDRPSDGGSVAGR